MLEKNITIERLKSIIIRQKNTKRMFPGSVFVQRALNEDMIVYESALHYLEHPEVKKGLDNQIRLVFISNKDLTIINDGVCISRDFLDRLLKGSEDDK